MYGRRLVKWLAVAALIGHLLPATAVAGCIYRGYNYGYNSYGYKSYGYNYGKSYWAGGYWPGGGGYGAGYYAPGYYSNYGNYYNDYYNYPSYYRFQAVIPVLNLPAYGSYYPDQASGYVPGNIPAAAAVNPAAYQARVSTGYGMVSQGYATQPVVSAPVPALAPAATPNCTMTADANNKLDKLLVIAGQTSDRLVKLEARVDVIEKGGSGGTIVPSRPTPTPTPAHTPVPTPAPAPPAKEAAPAANMQEEDVPTYLFNNCASCHHSKVAAKLGKKITLFIDGPEGSEMATLGPDGKPTLLSPATLQKIDEVMRDGTMPPERGVDNKPITPPTVQQRQKVREFIRQALAAQPPKKEEK